MIEFLSYQIPSNRFSAEYGDRLKLLPEDISPITTQLPQDIAIMRVVATLALTLLIALNLGTVFCCPLVIAGVGFACWTAYTHLLSKDPLVELFYKIVGGEENFNQLPEIDLQEDSNQNIGSAIQNLSWDRVLSPISRAKTGDGRHIVIIKATKYIPPLRSAKEYAHNLFVFIEKLGPRDLPLGFTSYQAEFISIFLDSILRPFDGNTFNFCVFLKDVKYFTVLNNQNSYTIHNQIDMCSSITASMANEFFAQLESLSEAD